MIFKGLSSQVPSASELGEEIGKLRIAAGRRAPAHVNDLRALARKVLGKQFKTDVDDSRWRRQQSICPYVAFPFVHFMHPSCYFSRAAAATRTPIGEGLIASTSIANIDVVAS
jgi:hypothetical protein